jgi:adenylate cyclase
MESSGEPGRVNVSQQTLDLLHDRFAVTPRGLVAAKGKGQLPMYFIEGERQP